LETVHTNHCKGVNKTAVYDLLTLIEKTQQKT